MIRALFFGLTLHGVVDQADNGWSYVEWQPTGEMAFVRTERLPAGTREGDAFQLRLIRDRGAPIDPDFELPTRLAVHGWRVRHSNTRSRRAP